MTFWSIFGLIGILCVPLIIMFLVCGIGLKRKIGGALAILIFWFLFSGALVLDETNKADNWNGGYCECGTHWELRGATKSRTGTETKYYACPNCHAEIRQ